jgi:polar amino acid transport system substrate-binding protein
MRGAGKPRWMGRNRMTTSLLRAAAIAAFMLLSAGIAVGGAQAQALDRILKDKKIKVCADLNSPPFGIIDAQGQPDGAEVEVARQFAKDLGVELELVQVTSAARIAALLAGRVDLCISSLSITTERAKAVMFSNPYGALNIVVAAPKAIDLKDAAGMVGKRIGMSRGTLEESVTTAIAPPGTNLVFFDEIGATIQALLSGQVDAISMTEHAIKAVADRAPDKQIETKFLVRRAYYGIALRYGDYDLLQWANTWVYQSKQNGSLAKIYQKWMGIPLAELPVL